MNFMHLNVSVYHDHYHFQCCPNIMTHMRNVIQRLFTQFSLSSSFLYGLLTPNTLFCFPHLSSNDEQLVSNFQMCGCLMRPKTFYSPAITLSTDSCAAAECNHAMVSGTDTLWRQRGETCSPELLHLREADVRGADRREWKAPRSCKMHEKYDFITAP